MITTTTQSAPLSFSTVPAADDVLGSADAAAHAFVNQQAATRKDELWHAEVSGDNAASADAPDVRVDAIKLGAGPGGEDVASTEEGNLFMPRTPESFSYDNDGNMLSDGRWIYTWNGENRLIQLETDPAVWSAVGGAIPRQKFLFAYDHIGRRTTKQLYTWDTQAADWTLTSSLRFIYDGWNLLAELEPVDYQAATFDFQVTRSYVWGTDLSGSLQGAGGVGGLLFATSATGTTLPTYDGNGNVMQYLSTTDATVTAAYTYTPFGQTLTASGETNTHLYRFSTKYTDESGLVYYGFRYYDAERGRWVNRDPIEEMDAPNINMFCANSAIYAYDKIGRLSKKGHSAIQKLISDTTVLVKERIVCPASMTAYILANIYDINKSENPRPWYKNPILQQRLWLGQTILDAVFYMTDHAFTMKKQDMESPAHIYNFSDAGEWEGPSYLSEHSGEPGLFQGKAAGYLQLDGDYGGRHDHLFMNAYATHFFGPTAVIPFFIADAVENSASDLKVNQIGRGLGQLTFASSGEDLQDYLYQSGFIDESECVCKHKGKLRARDVQRYLREVQR